MIQLTEAKLAKDVIHTICLENKICNNELVASTKPHHLQLPSHPLPISSFPLPSPPILC